MGLFKRKNKQDEKPAEVADRQQLRHSTLVVYYAKDGWRWRLIAPNGKITAESGEAYKRRYDCRVAGWALATDSIRPRVELRER